MCSVQVLLCIDIVSPFIMILGLTKLKLSSSFVSFIWLFIFVELISHNLRLILWQSLRARTERALVKRQTEDAVSKVAIKEILSFTLTEKVFSVLTFSLLFWILRSLISYVLVTSAIYGAIPIILIIFSGYLREGNTSSRSCQGKLLSSTCHLFIHWFPDLHLLATSNLIDFL